MIVELFKESYLDSYLEYFQKNKKKFNNVRRIFGVFWFLLFAMFVLIQKNYILFAGLPIAFLIGYKIPYLNMLLNKKQKDLLNSFLFPQFLQSFMAVLPSSGNVYQTLVQSLTYTSEPLHSELEKLIKKIENENKREDYLAFAEYTGSSEAYMIMDMIYQFSEFGVKKEALQQLSGYIQNLQENKIEELITRKMANMDLLGFGPVLIVLFLIGGFTGVILLQTVANIPILGEIF